MLKASLFIVLGVIAGAGLATLLDREPMPDFGAGATGLVAESGPDSELAQRLAALESALAEEAERRASLEAQFVLVTEQLDELVSTERSAALNVAEPGEDVVINPAFEGFRGPRGARFAAMREQRSPENRQSRLIEAGFSPEQAQSLIDREAQMRMDLMNASYEARRQGESFNPIDMQREAQAQLHAELGADAYERYLEATGQPTSVNVFEVIDNSAGQTAGLQTGDEIVGYNGERVFSLRDLQALTIAGEPGETVAVDILRDGQPMQIYMPRGPLGITGGGRGRAGAVFLP
jgi:hypothetical protein